MLRSIKYGETSLVVTIFTELFGSQTYMVNGARSAKKTGNKAVMYQPGAILQLQVYHNELKAMHRIKEAGWEVLYKHIFSDVIKNSIVLFMIELLHKVVRQPEINNDLFYFCEDCLKHVDEGNAKVAANMPVFFAIHLTHFLGLKINEDFKNSTGEIYLDLVEGNFTDAAPVHGNYLPPEDALITLEILRTQHPEELAGLSLNQQKRRQLIMQYMNFYTWHIPDFGQMKTLKILGELLS